MPDATNPFPSSSLPEHPPEIPLDPSRPFFTPEPPTSAPAPLWQSLQQSWTTHTQPHLEELRRRLALSLLSLGAGMALGWSYAAPAIGMLQRLAPASTQFIQMAPGDTLMVTLKVSLVIGLGIASPVILYQVIRFLLPGLTLGERRWLLILVLGGSGLFATGVGLAWFLLVPTAIAWMLAFGQGLVIPQIGIVQYLDTCLTLLLLTGLLSELPLLLLAAMGLGWIRSHQLMARWREVLIAVLVISAVITPTWDPLTLCLLALPLLVLLGLTIALARVLRW